MYITCKNSRLNFDCLFPIITTILTQSAFESYYMDQFVASMLCSRYKSISSSLCSLSLLSQSTILPPSLNRTRKHAHTLDWKSPPPH